jgi:hypothetical protein
MMDVAASVNSSTMVNLTEEKKFHILLKGFAAITWLIIGCPFSGGDKPITIPNCSAIGNKELLETSDLIIH